MSNVEEVGGGRDLLCSVYSLVLFLLLFVSFSFPFRFPPFYLLYLLHGEV